ncbi:hypothetical protein BUY79_12625 [Staphylococcus equorum]|uniref:helix-turn-helix domain-containing protein n=1 Tax=Staphylococcus equorum TaxID=246432 RepID=UPI000D1CD719|nr:helix-turn-helix domain-containing protein [Staphylococcus equorum]PTE82526.1 hypothetical protein BUY79_12625 [Staphylococcus equorum]
MEKVKQKRKQWEQSEIDRAVELYNSGMNFSQIGEQLGRPSISVNKKLQALGIKSNKKMLYDIESVRGYIIDVDEAKQTTHQSGKKILFKCSTDGCNKEKMMTVQSLVRRGFSCPNCSTGIRYPESFFTAYLEVKNIPYETQVIFDDLSDRRFDFCIKLNGGTSLVETHGEQHYYTEDRAYHKVETIQESDSVKRNYAKNNNINYIELDCRESTFEFVRNSIENNKHLPNIEDTEIEEMLHLIKINSVYDIKEIVEMYKSGKSTIQIGESLGYDAMTIGRILKRNNIKLRNSGSPKRMVRLIETNQIYTSGLEAMRETGISNSNISLNCNGKLKSVGKHTVTNDKLHWETVSEKEQQAIQLAKQSASNHTDKDINLSTDGLSDSFMALLG